MLVLAFSNLGRLLKSSLGRKVELMPSLQHSTARGGHSGAVRQGDRGPGPCVFLCLALPCLEQSDNLYKLPFDAGESTARDCSGWHTLLLRLPMPPFPVPACLPPPCPPPKPPPP